MLSLQYLDPSKHEIRLIGLLPRSQVSQSEQICCTLEHASLEDDLRYSALSYVWGLPGITEPILVNGSIFKATANLESALRHLQHDNEIVTLWIDAICINQQDDAEKTHQVKQMDLIYTRAMKVIVWLGLASGDSDLALDKLEELGKQAISVGILKEAVSLRTVQKYGIYLDMPKSNRNAARRRRLNKMFFHFTCGDSESHTIPVAATRSLFDRPWWGRVWILQELVLADNAFIVCGDKVIHWDDLRAAILFIDVYLGRQFTLPWSKIWHNLRSFNERPKLISLMSSVDQMNNVSKTFYTYLTTTCNASEGRNRAGYGFFDATDPRDKIFALLSLPEDTADLGIQADYSKSCGTVYTDTSEALILAMGPNILCFCQRPKSVSELPSWVPDWSLPLKPMLYTHRIEKVWCSASGSDEFTIAFGRDSVNARVLFVSGVRVDTIHQTGIACSGDWDKIENHATWAVSWLMEFQRLSELGVNTCYSPTQRTEALWQTPIASWERGYKSSDLAHRHYGILTGAINPDKSSVQDEDQLRLSEAKKYHHEMILRAAYRRPFVTTQGYLGLGPEWLEKGDLACIFLGANVPFILRERHDGQYELVGESYIHGIMDGEVMKQGPKIETFRIC